MFGAAAASASLLRLTAGQSATALAIAASLSSGLKANFRGHDETAPSPPMWPERPVAALLAPEGFTACFDTFEHPQGFFHVFSGEGNFDAGAVLQD